MGHLASAALCGALFLALAACTKPAEPEKAAAPSAASATATAASAAPALPAANPERNAYFGALHVHTGWSFDGFTNGSKTTPSDAYAWAQGREITNSGFGDTIQIRTPLDFYMVSEHAEYMGVFNPMANPDSPLSKHELAKGVTSSDANTRIQTFAGILRDMSAGKHVLQMGGGCQRDDGAIAGRARPQASVSPSAVLSTDRRFSILARPTRRSPTLMMTTRKPSTSKLSSFRGMRPRQCMASPESVLQLASSGATRPMLRSMSDSAVRPGASQ